MKYYLIDTEHNNIIGPFDSYKESDEFVSVETTIRNYKIVKECYEENQYGAPEIIGIDLGSDDKTVISKHFNHNGKLFTTTDVVKSIKDSKWPFLTESEVTGDE